MTFFFAPGWAPFDVASEVLVTVDNEELTAPRVLSDRSWTCHLYRDDQGEWQVGQREEKGLHKRPGLQGPIDDAFMDSFIMVRPTGKSPHAAIAKWGDAEMNRAIKNWRSLFRGDARFVRAPQCQLRVRDRREYQRPGPLGRGVTGETAQVPRSLCRVRLAAWLRGFGVDTVFQPYYFFLSTLGRRAERIGNSVRDLVLQSDDQLLQVRNFGETTLSEVKERLGAIGLRLGMKLPQSMQRSK